MARDNPINIRLEDSDREFLQHLAEKDHRKEGTLAYIFILECLNEHGYQAWLKEREANLSSKNS